MVEEHKTVAVRTRECFPWRREGTKGHMEVIFTDMKFSCVMVQRVGQTPVQLLVTSSVWYGQDP